MICQEFRHECRYLDFSAAFFRQSLLALSLFSSEVEHDSIFGIFYRLTNRSSRAWVAQLMYIDGGMIIRQYDKELKGFGKAGHVLNNAAGDEVPDLD